MIATQARRLDGYQVAVFQNPALDSPADARARQAFATSCRELEARVLPTAESTTPQRTESIAKRAVVAVDTDAAERRRRQSKALIGVHVIPEDDGLALLLARLPIEEAARVHAAIDARARSAVADCTATMGELRVRALVDALCGSGTPTPDVTTEIQVVIDAAALVGLTDCPATVASGPLTGSPLSAQAVRDMVTDPDVPTALRRLVTDPLTGHLLDRGRRSYQVSDAMRAFLNMRDRIWRSWSPVEPSRSGPGSGRRECVNGEHRGDRLPEPDRRQWHRQLMASHHSRIRESRADGSCVWRSPPGHIYDVGPPPV